MKLFAFAGTLRLAANKLVCYAVNLACGGGTCCGGTYHPAAETGDCCNDVWYAGDDSCPEGHVYRRWGEFDECCGCLPEQIVDPRVQAEVPIDTVLDVLCCGCDFQYLMPFDEFGTFRGCVVACCDGSSCENKYQQECDDLGRTIVGKCCEVVGCPIDCCFEDDDGVVQCDSIGSLLCVGAKVPATTDCATGCVGQCCIDGEPQGMMTQEACAAMDGKWSGLGKEDCDDCACRDPFSCDCCESTTSTAAGLTFNQPRNKRHPAWTKTFRVLATGHTESPILIHGEYVAPNCDFEVEFFLCWESFNVEPVPCQSTFKKLDIKVCWFEHVIYEESLNFSGCNTGLSIHLGDCEDDCFTTLVYDQEDTRVSDAHIYTRADAELHVESGTIEFTGDITAVSVIKDGAPCASSPRLLKLTGGVGKISGVIEDLAGDDYVEVRVLGGEWWLSGLNTFSGPLKVLSGTAVIAANVNSSANTASPFGMTNGASRYPTVGGNYDDVWFLLADGVNVGRDFNVIEGAALVVLGGYETATCAFSNNAATITIRRPVTLKAGHGAVVTFQCGWSISNGPQTITVGMPSNDGAVEINNYLPALCPLVVAHGTARIGISDCVDPAAPITLEAGTTLDLAGNSQTTEDLTLSGNNGTVTGGTLVLGGSGASAVSVSGSGHNIESDVTLGNAAAFTVNAFSGLTISGVIDGANTITLDGGGTLTLSASNLYSGTTTIDGGTAVAGNVNAFGTGGITVNAGGTLDTNGFTLPNTITNNGGTVI